MVPRDWDGGLLSVRETEVLGLIGSGRTNRQIADQLVISLGTVERHVHNILTKLGCSNRTAAAALAGALVSPGTANSTDRRQDTDSESTPRSSRPAVTSRARAGHHVPSYRTSFVGREALMEEIGKTLRTGRAQLLTLTGPGGAGKTRLAIEAAASLRGVFDGGIHFVALAGVTDSARVPGVIAQVLGVRDAGDTAVMHRLAAFLSEHPALLILDNLEHLPEVADLVGELLSTPGVAVLATSRSPLRLYGEKELNVPPLPLPDGMHGQSGEQPWESEAMALFVERAQAVVPSFALTTANVKTVAEICSRLDGLPLAIELAAPRIKLLSLEALLRRLDGRLNLLTLGPRDRERRQQTLRATIDWSHELLTGKEMALFRRLAVFRGGFTMDAVETICPEGDLLPAEVFQVVASLADKSLLQRQEGVTGGDRLMMLQTIREYAAERLLESGEQANLAERHANHYAALAVNRCPGLLGRGQAEQLLSLAAEVENMRQALGWFARSGRMSQLAAMAVAFQSFWQIQGEYTEGRAWLARALESPRASLDDSLRSQALLASGLLAWRQGEGAAGRAVLQEAVAILRPVGSTPTLGRCLANLGMSMWFAGEPAAEGERLCEDAVAMLRDVDDRWGLADALHLLGHMVIERGDLDAAQSVWEESCALSASMGDRWGAAPALKDLGLVASRRGEVGKARQLYHESLAVLRETGEKGHIADTLNRLGELSLIESQRGGALQLFSEALSLMRELGHRAGYIETLNRIAEVNALDGDFTQARERYEECLEESRRMGNERLVAGMLNNLGNLALCEERPLEAAAHFRESVRIHEGLGRHGSLAIALEGLASAQARLGTIEAAAATFARSTLSSERAGPAFDAFDRIEHRIGRSNVPERLPMMASEQDTA